MTRRLRPLRLESEDVERQLQPFGRPDLAPRRDPAALVVDDEQAAVGRAIDPVDAAPDGEPAYIDAAPFPDSQFGVGEGKSTRGRDLHGEQVGHHPLEAPLDEAALGRRARTLVALDEALDDRPGRPGCRRKTRSPERKGAGRFELPIGLAQDGMQEFARPAGRRRASPCLRRR